MNKLFSELRRRNVFRVAGVYSVVGWVLAQVATTLEETLGLPAWFDSLIVAVLLIGLPVAIVLAWAFELTPEGVLRTQDVPVDESITADTARKLDVAIVVGLALLVGMMLWQNLRDESEPQSATPVAASDVERPAPEASIAVLPFADLSPEGDQEYFSDGIAEEILNVLVGVNGLDVASRTSSFQFKNVGLGIPEIAAELDVRHVVEGSVRKSGSTIRVTAQLIDSANDRHLWSATYDRPLTAENVFEIQDEIANAIVDALSGALGVGDIAPIEVHSTTRNLDAYELFLQARLMFHDRIDLDVADGLLAQAVDLDPEFARAWEIRSALQPLAREYGYSDTSLETAQRRADEFASRALSLEPDSATAIAVLAKIKSDNAGSLLGSHDLAEVLADFNRALAIEPRNASALNWRGLTYLLIGDLESALADFEACFAFEPHYRPCVENHYTVLGNQGNDEASNSAYLRALNNSSAKVEFAYLPSLARTGEELAFKMATNGPYMLSGWRRHDELWEAYLDPTQDHTELIESIVQHLHTKGEGFLDVEPYIVHPIGTGWRTPIGLTMWDPTMHEYRQSAEFRDFIRESGVYNYWIMAGFPPQCRQLANDEFECS